MQEKGKVVKILTFFKKYYFFPIIGTCAMLSGGLDSK